MPGELPVLTSQGSRGMKEVTHRKHSGQAWHTVNAMEAFALTIIIIWLPQRHHGPRAGSQGLGVGGTSEAETRERRASLLPSSLSSPPSHSLQPASPLCSDRRTRPLVPVSHLWLPCPCPVPPWVPKGRFITPQLPAPPPTQHVRSPWPPAKAWGCQQRQRDRNLTAR